MIYMKPDKQEIWETIEKYKEPIKIIGNFLVGFQIYERIIYVQKNKKTGEIRKI